MTTVSDQLYWGGGVPVIASGQFPIGNTKGNYFFVDGTNGSDGNTGLNPSNALKTIQKAFTNNSKQPNLMCMVLPKAITDMTGDPTSYAETVVIDAPSSALIGVSRGRTQGGLPQLKAGSGSTPQITVSAPGCLITGMGINGVGATGGGVLLNDDNSTVSAFGTTIIGCHFKNCVGSTATNAATGGAIMWTAAGNAWQILIKGNRFYKNVGDVVLKGTSNTVPQDVVIEDNEFSGPAASVDCNLYLAGGSGINGVIIRRNSFPCWPAIGSGTNVMPVDLTGCVGTLEFNTFGSTGKTFGAAANALVPTTVLMSGNYQESGLIART